jgi:hypothetical protein
MHNAAFALAVAGVIVPRVQTRSSPCCRAPSVTEGCTPLPPSLGSCHIQVHVYRRERDALLFPTDIHQQARRIVSCDSPDFFSLKPFE